MLTTLQACAMIGTLLLPSACALPQDELAAVRAHRQQHAHQILRDYAQLLAIPNVASDAINIRRNADWIVNAFRARGAEMELLEWEDAPPIVFGTLGPETAERTLGIYVHYDGQPVDAERWSTPPWEARLFTAAIEDGGEARALPGPGEEIDPEWRLYARAAGDDKAPIPAILTALDALRAEGRNPSSRLLFFFEGEEEAGSPHLANYLRQYRERLEVVDAWLICDGPVHQSRRPQLVFGVRGYSGLDITIYGAARNLHSGHYGNWAPNPAMMLSQLLASMKDADGRVLIEGYHDTVAPLSTKDREALQTIPDYDEQLRHELGLARSEADNAALKERILLPSLNVRGFQSASVGATARNIVPNQARASLDVRLVRGNEPADMLDRIEQHIRKQGYHIVRTEPDLETRRKYPKLARVDRRPNYPAARTSMDVPIAAHLEQAVRVASGEEPVLLPTLGGSLPLYLFTDFLGKPTIIVPIANHDDNQHAPDENIRLANLWYGIDLMAAIFIMPGS